MRRILVVEDDSSLREMLEDWLVIQKFTVVSCETSQEAIEQISLLPFDALLLDWHLRQGTGMEILHYYRRHGGKGMVLMLTGSTTRREQEEALKAGANAYLNKPFKLSELSARLNEIMPGGENKQEV